jgi:hypothetical protein
MPKKDTGYITVTLSLDVLGMLMQLPEGWKVEHVAPATAGDFIDGSVQITISGDDLPMAHRYQPAVHVTPTVLKTERGDEWDWSCAPRKAGDEQAS